MLELLTSEFFAKYPILQTIAAILILAAGGLAMWRGERAKRLSEEKKDEQNRVMTMIDMMQFEARMEDNFRERRRATYDRIDTLDTRVRLLETEVAVMTMAHDRDRQGLQNQEGPQRPVRPRQR